MKYNENNKPLECLLTQSTCYKGTVKYSPIRGVLWHSTGANNPKLKRYVQPSDDAANKAELLEIIGVNKYNNDFNHIDIQQCHNAFIGKLADETVASIQTLPWDYKPWGCGSGAKGSCNNGWIQFEICEDSLEDEEYFNAIYQEGCELTAYLLTMFNLDPKGVTKYKGVDIPVVLCHAEAHKLGFGSNHSDVLHWFKKYNKTMDDVRNDVAKLMTTKSEVEKPISNEIYRVRTSWENAKSQKGAFVNLQYAIDTCNKLGSEYAVFDSKGNKVFPVIQDIPQETINKVIEELTKPSIPVEEVKVHDDAPTEEKKEIIKTPIKIIKPILESVITPAIKEEYEIGDAVRLLPGAKYASGGTIPVAAFNRKLYIRGKGKIKDTYIIAAALKGAVYGTVKADMLLPYVNGVPAAANFTSYIVRILEYNTPVHSGPGTKYAKKLTLAKDTAFTIVAENNGWGKLLSGAGWIELIKTKKVREVNNK